MNLPRYHNSQFPIYNSDYMPKGKKIMKPLKWPSC